MPAHNHSLLHSQRHRCCTALVLFLCLLPTFVKAGGQLDKVITLDIPAKTHLEDALIQWGLATGVTVMINTSSVADQETDGVQGTVAARDALVSLLRRSGLKYKEEGNRISVVPNGNFVHSRLRKEDSEFGGTTSDSAISDESSVPLAPDSNAEKNEKNRNSSSLEEVVVTAQRREERLIDTPIAVTALDTDMMSRTGIKGIADFADSVPGVTISTLGGGVTQIDIRGVTTGADVNPTVAIYIDDVAVPSSGSTLSTPDTVLFDLDRIEVLRGPQGTMYGDSSMGGLLKYVTKLPELNSSSAQIQAGVADIHDGGVDYNGGVAVNVPLVQGVLGVRASVYATHSGGYYDNVELGLSEVDRANAYGARLDTLFKPNDALSVRVAGLVQYNDRKGNASADYTLTGQPIQGVQDQIRGVREPFSSEFHLIDTTVSYDFGPAKLTSITAYQDFYWRLASDVAYFVPTLQTYYDYYPFNTYSAAQDNYDVDFEKFSQELRLESVGSGPLQWVLGSFYSHQSNPVYANISGFTATGQETAYPGIYQTAAGNRLDEVAGFGDMTVRLTRSLDITGGVRYAKVTVANVTNLDISIFGSNANPYEKSADHVVTYLGNVRYHFDDNQMGYLRYATGYRPGGPNTVGIDPATGQLAGPRYFTSDSLKSYEVGYKDSAFDGRLAVDVAGYHINWTDIQISAFTGGFGYIENAPGGASIWGLELSVSGRPAQSLLLSGTFAYQNAYLREAQPDLGAYAGERLPFVPHVTGTLSADYTFAGLPWQPSVGTSMRYVDARWESFDQNSGYPQYHLPDYALIDLRAGMHFASLDLQFYVRNALNKLGQISANTGDVNAQVTYVQPRTIGLSLTKQF